MAEGELAVAASGQKVAATAGRKCWPQQQHSKNSKGRIGDKLGCGRASS